MKWLVWIPMVLSCCCVFAEGEVSTRSPQALYEPKDYNRLIGMPGFSDKALKTHFTLYQGYVRNVNLLSQLMKQLVNDGKGRSPEWAELRRRFGWEFDGMRLHEIYFSSLGGDGKVDVDSPLYRQIVAQFGSYETWKRDFVNTGSMRGIGWAILYLDPENGMLVNTWINEHDLGHLAGGTPLLPMDVFEHAFMIDYGLDRASYIDAFFRNINWEEVNKRFPSEKAGKEPITGTMKLGE